MSRWTDAHALYQVTNRVFFAVCGLKCWLGFLSEESGWSPANLGQPAAVREVLCFCWTHADEGDRQPTSAVAILLGREPGQRRVARSRDRGQLRVAC